MYIEAIITALCLSGVAVAEYGDNPRSAYGSGFPVRPSPTAGWGGDGGAEATPTGSGTSSSSTSSSAPLAANVVQRCPSTNLCYSVNIPEAGSTDLYFQITAPTTMSWAALGQGSSMSGSNIFAIYANAAGTNVTLSPRLGTGHVMPQSDTSAFVTLLAGSGITGNKMTANIKCTNCQSWSGGTMSYTSSSAPFIWAYKSGSSLASDSVSTPISEHDGYGSMSLNLASATGGSSNNPFLAAAVTTSPGTGSNSGASDNSGITSGTSASAAMQTAHGGLGFTAFVILFPLGAIVLRILNWRFTIWIHVAIQMISYILALAVLGTGISLASQGRLGLVHPIIGLVVICALFFQPILGVLHHLAFKARGRNGFTLPHIFWGRVFITLGIINGGLGLQLSMEGRSITIAYAVIAAVMWVIWMASAVLAWRRKQNGMMKIEVATPLGNRTGRSVTPSGSRGLRRGGSGVYDREMREGLRTPDRVFSGETFVDPRGQGEEWRGQYYPTGEARYA